MCPICRKKITQDDFISQLFFQMEEDQKSSSDESDLFEIQYEVSYFFTFYQVAKVFKKFIYLAIMILILWPRRLGVKHKFFCLSTVGIGDL